MRNALKSALTEPSECLDKMQDLRQCKESSHIIWTCLVLHRQGQVVATRSMSEELSTVIKVVCRVRNSS